VLEKTITELCTYSVAATLDWVGSLLMMATLWGWIYRRIAPGLEKIYLKSRRHKKAIYRLYNYKLHKMLPTYENLISYNYKIGINEETSFFDRISLVFNNHRIHHRLEKYDLLTEEDANEWADRTYQSKFLSRLAIMSVLNTLYSGLQYRLSRVIHLSTMSLFTGKLGFFLFCTGLIMWNTGKLIVLVLRMKSS
jgi:hypothetical protein